VTNSLGALLSEDDALTATARLAIWGFADACWIHLAAQSGAPQLAGAWQSQDIPELLLPEAHEARLITVLRTLLPDVAGVGASPASLIVPMSVAGVSIGALTVAFGGGRSQPGPDELAMAEDLAIQAAAAVERARVHERTQKALSARDDSFAAAAHELGNPLNALLLQVNALTRAHSLEPRELARIFAMERLIKQLVDLNHRMLDTSRLASGQFDLRLEEVDLTHVVQDVLANNADQLAWSKCPVAFSAPAHVIGRWDRLRLEQVVSNLVSNAMKYGHGAAISVAIDATEASARLRIGDRGIGIAAEDQERIFERFERASSMLASTSLGLGLWVVRQIVTALGGNVRVESSLGEGATFIIELPRVASSAEPDQGGTTA
jgi:signal transduction histidine kinase